MYRPGVFILLAALMAFPGGALAAGDAKKGQRIFNRCKACHSLVEGQRRIGPSLYGMFGREAGTLPGYSYSTGMKKSKVVWDEKTLDAYLTNPRSFVKGTKMAFPGLPKKDDREDLIAYLKEATKAK